MAENFPSSLMRGEFCPRRNINQMEGRGRRSRRHFRARLPIDGRLATGGGADC